MSNYKRNGNRWTVNEVLSLQREYELLGLSIDEIADKHGRSPKSIMFKLDSEGFANYNEVRMKYNSKSSANIQAKDVVLEPSLSEDEDDEQDDDKDEDFIDNGEDDESDYDDEDDDPLSKRVAKLESGLDEIKEMLRSLTKSKTSANKLSYNTDLSGPMPSNFKSNLKYIN